MEEKSTFLKIDKFEAVMASLAALKRKLTETQEILGKIESLKQEEDAAIQKWSADLSSVQTKIQTLESEMMQE